MKVLEGMAMNLATDKNLEIEIVNNSITINLHRSALNALQRMQLEFFVRVVSDACNEFYVDFWGNEYCHCDITISMVTR